MDDILSVTFWLKNYGPLGAISITILTVGWRAWKKIWIFLKPYVIQLLESLIGLVIQLHNSDKRQTELMERTVTVQESQLEILQGISKDLASFKPKEPS